MIRFAMLPLLFLVIAPHIAWCEDASISFNRDIRPILSDKCFFCHGPDATHREADLRFDDEMSAKQYAIVSGDAEASELVARILEADADLRMPPPESGKKLDQQEIKLLQQWIDDGAAYEPYWAYVPPQQAELPAPDGADWPRNWIDRFILARLAQEGLEPSADADPVTLVRRLYFDLTGLPPTPQQVAEYVAQADDPAAYEQLVDRLLASDAYGERMAMYWLDLVRYADTVGYHGDQDHNITPYRDYVIDAFCDNMPFDQFTREQLAGDLLNEPTLDQKIATGYNRLLQTSHEGGVQPKEYLAIYAADRVRNVSNVWMGATMGCCQCHDHKYDPYSIKDFYAMAAFFADVDEADHFKNGTNALPTRRTPEIKVLTKRQRERIEALKSELAKLSADDESLKAERDSIARQIKAIEDAARLTMITQSTKPRTMRVLPRGDWLDDSGPIVEPDIPEFLGSLAGDQRATRLDLATWLTDQQQGVGGLTARVMANRFWYLLFGTGISGTLDDFGGQGEPPVHPELLDALALEFLESGWDVKHMMKLIVTSRAYRQASLVPSGLAQRDPYNRLYARQSRFRLPAEMVRDNALAISGLLVREVGGPSVKPYQPVGYYRHLNFPPRKYHSHNDQRQWRRGLYVHWQRQFLHPMLKALDAPTREECTAQRSRSNTPTAALALLNDPTFVEAARKFAERILAEGGSSDAARIDYAFRWAVSRSPAEQEQKIVTKLLNSSRQSFAERAEQAKRLLATGLAPTAADVPPAELASWTTVARAILNMNETITRN